MKHENNLEKYSFEAPQVPKLFYKGVFLFDTVLFKYQRVQSPGDAKQHCWKYLLDSGSE